MYINVIADETCARMVFSFKIPTGCERAKDAIDEYTSVITSAVNTALESVCIAPTCRFEGVIPKSYERILEQQETVLPNQSVPFVQITEHPDEGPDDLTCPSCSRNNTYYLGDCEAECHDCGETFKVDH